MLQLVSSCGPGAGRRWRELEVARPAESYRKLQSLAANHQAAKLPMPQAWFSEGGAHATKGIHLIPWQRGDVLARGECGSNPISKADSTWTLHNFGDTALHPEPPVACVSRADEVIE